MNNLSIGYYGKTRISLKPTDKLLKIAYESMLKFNGQARVAIKNNDIEKRTNFINKSSAVLIELRASLDVSEHEISESLYGLYSYLIWLLMRANLENSMQRIDEVNDNIKELLKICRENNDFT